MKGLEVKKILQQHNIVLADLARKMGVSPQHLNNIFKSPDISTGRIEELSKISNINIFSLLGSNFKSSDSINSLEKKNIERAPPDRGNTEQLIKEVALKDKIIEQLEKTIEDKEEIITMLKTKATRTDKTQKGRKSA